MLASLPSQRWRSTVLAVGAAFVATFATGETVPLWLGVAALVFGSVAEDLPSVPWIGWVGGLLGSVLVAGHRISSTATRSSPRSSASLFGGSLGPAAAGPTAHRSSSRARRRLLRGRAAWLEQRTSLARELHDVVGHHVTAMVVQAEAGQMADPEAALRNIGELGRKALGELDALVVHLRDPSAPISVTRPPRLLDIDELLAAPLRLQGVEVDVRLDAELGLDEVEVLTVYRIAQEALTNVTRHAQATHTWVELTRTDDRVRLRVSDDGVGPATALRAAAPACSGSRSGWPRSAAPGT